MKTLKMTNKMWMHKKKVANAGDKPHLQGHLLLETETHLMILLMLSVSRKVSNNIWFQ
jgi:hypothetical protein